MLLHTPEIDLAVHKLAVRQRERPVFNVMVSVDHGEHSVVHMPNLIASGGVNQIELQRLPIR